jgi:hypothetical protein
MKTRKSRYDLLSEVKRLLEVVKGPDDRGEYTCWCPFHPDGHGKSPHSPNLNVSVRGYCCHACGEKGSLEQLAKRLGLHPISGESLPDSVYPYHDEHGKLLFEVCRYTGKKFFQRRLVGTNDRAWGLKGTRRVLYRLPELISSSDKMVFIPEGEKDVDRLRSEGVTSTTNPGGAGKWKQSYSPFFRGRDAVIIPDNDEPGYKHAKQVARSLEGYADSVKILHLPELPLKGDVSDWLDAGRTIEELIALVTVTSEQEEALTQTTEPMEEKCNSKIRSEGPVCMSAMALPDRLVFLALKAGVELFTDQLGKCFGRFNVDGHKETWPCDSKFFKNWIAMLLWNGEAKTVSTMAMKASINTLGSIARFEGGKHSLSNRVAYHDSKIWYDLSSEKWEFVKVTPFGWEIVLDPPILFRRFSHQSTQVYPALDGDLHAVLDLVNLKNADDKLLLLVYIVSCFIPDIPHPVVIAHGTSGSGKTTFQRIIRAIVDPSHIPLLSIPHSKEELIQQLNHHWAPLYDNISSLSEEISDVLCRAVTGDGYSKRELFSDDEDVIYNHRRVVGLNGINAEARKSDLLNRAILFALDHIPEEKRMTEAELNGKLGSVLPGILGGVFNTLSRAMALIGSIHLETMPRMADFAVWGCAIAEALGYAKEDFLAAYNRNALVRHEEALDASSVGSLIRGLMAGTSQRWEGSATNLLNELADLAKCNGVSPKGSSWPKSVEALSRKLNEISPDLLKVGIRVKFTRSACHRTITIERDSKGGEENQETGAAQKTTYAHDGSVANDGISRELCIAGTTSSGFSIDKENEYV